jgi:hypothetical protein
MTGQRCDGWISKKINNRDFYGEMLAYELRNPDREQGVTADIKKVIVGTHASNAQDLGPDRRELFL